MRRNISETCWETWYVPNKKGFIKAPTSKKEWLDIATEFDNKWNFPHCLGAIYGKDIIIQAPPRKGSTFFNYKKSFSIALLAICNINCFTLVDIGEASRQNDGRICNNSKLGMAIGRSLLHIPEPRAINEYSVTNKISVCFHCRWSFRFETFYVKTFFLREMTSTFINFFSITDCLVQDKLLKTPSGY